MKTPDAFLSEKLDTAGIKRSVLPEFVTLTVSPAIAALAVILVAFIATPDIASAQCQQFLQPHVDFIKNKSKGVGTYSVVATFVFLHEVHVAGYGTADLDLNPSQTALTGTASVLRSSKTTSNGNPFDINQPKSMQMTISVDTGKVTLGNDTIDAPQCSDGSCAPNSSTPA